MNHISILLYLCQKCYQGIISNTKKEYFPTQARTAWTIQVGFEVKEIRGYIKDGQVGWYQVKLGLGFRVLDPRGTKPRLGQPLFWAA